MVFSSPIFLFIFLPITVTGYYLIRPNFRNYWLLFVSLVFYSWGEPRFVLLMILFIGINYGFGILLDRTEKKMIRRGILGAALFLDIGMLFVFKYLGFFCELCERLLHLNLVSTDSPVMHLRMPIGISFFTFQIISYVIDVYRKDVKAQKNPWKLGLYISFFPQLIAGPIVRYKDIEEQINRRTINMEKVYMGTLRFSIGFIKKVLFSNTVAQVATISFDNRLADNSALVAWLGILAYTLQIYYDFSGYSDMAIGLGKVFGFEFRENFNYPYTASSMKDFWRRWHISLSSWFRDYLYIPLGGNRKGQVRTYINLFIVFLVTGLWHGAGYNFVFWGLFHGLFLVLERGWFGKVLEKLPKAIRRVYVLFCVMIAWVFFRADTMHDAIRYIKDLFAFNRLNARAVFVNINVEQMLFIVLGILFATPLVSMFGANVRDEKKEKRLLRIGYLVLVALTFYISITYMTGSGFNPFIYFRF